MIASFACGVTEGRAEVYHVGMTEQESQDFGIENYSETFATQIKYQNKFDDASAKVSYVLSWIPTTVQLLIIYFSKELLELAQNSSGSSASSSFFTTAASYMQIGPVDLSRFLPSVFVSVPAWFAAKTIVPVFDSIQQRAFKQAYRWIGPMDEERLMLTTNLVKDRAEQECRSSGAFQAIDDPTSRVLRPVILSKDQIENGENQLYLDGRKISWNDLRISSDQDKATLYVFQTLRCLTSRHQESFISNLSY